MGYYAMDQPVLGNISVGSRPRFKEGCIRDQDCFECMGKMEYGLDTPDCILVWQAQERDMTNTPGISVTLTTKRSTK